jgi:predicted metalloprotease with PDZ domain
MRRSLLVLMAVLTSAPLVAVAAPDVTPKQHEFHWSFSSEKGRLGIMVLGLTAELRTHFGAPDDRGLMVAHVEPGSAAAAAGVQVGDIITTVEGHPARDAGDVISAIAKIKKGGAVAIEAMRDGKPVTLRATLTDEPMPAGMEHGSFEQFERHMGPEMRDMFHDMFRDWPWSDRGKPTFAPNKKPA